MTKLITIIAFLAPSLIVKGLSIYQPEPPVYKPDPTPAYPTPEPEPTYSILPVEPYPQPIKPTKPIKPILPIKPIQPYPIYPIYPIKPIRPIYETPPIIPLPYEPQPELYR